MTTKENMKYLVKTLSEAGELSASSEPLGTGGEGSVYSISSHTLKNLPEADELVIKVYHDPAEGNRFKKIAAMISSPPESDSVAWPLAIVFTEQKTFAGYVMKKLDYDSYRPWAELAHAGQRRTVTGAFDVRYGITAAMNLAVALDSIHSAGHVVGDVNESNIFIGNDATVFIVDSDSAQISESSGRIYPCLVGKPEYTAPELSHGSLKDQRRTIETDAFAFAVASWQMLTGGSHPTDGILLSDDDPPSVVEKMRDGIYPALKPNPSYKLPPRVAIEGIPSRFKKLFVKLLEVDPAERPSFDVIISVFNDVLQNLEECSKNKAHWFDRRDGGCGWCAHAEAGKPDPWARSSQLSRGSSARQVSLPPVSFGSSGSQPSVAPHRAAPTVAGAPKMPVSSPVYPTAGGYSQSGPGYPQQIPTGSYSQPSQPSAPQPPKKIKGKAVVFYQDGSYGPRPDYATLFSQSPKIALRCLRDETPNFAHFWWDKSRDIAELSGLYIGLAISIIVAVQWIFLPEAAEALNPAKLPIWNLTYKIWSFASIASSIIFSLILFFSALSDRRRTIKKYGNLDGFKKENKWKTSLRFFIVSLLYGPPFVVVLALSLLFLAVTSVFEKKR